MQHRQRAIRQPLKDLMGEVVEVSGRIERINDGSDNTDERIDVLVVNAKITHLVPDRTLPQCDCYAIDHLWIKHDVGEWQTITFDEGGMQRYEPLISQGTPYRYTRADGSVDYGVRVWGQMGVKVADEIAKGVPSDGDWNGRVDLLEHMVTRASNNQLRVNTVQQTHDEVLALLKHFLKQARINSRAVAKAPRGTKPKAPTFAHLLRRG